MNMAAMYTDENRVYMEYVDNSLDAAEKFFNAKTNSYNKEIKISLVIAASGKVVFKDNCSGITNFKKVIEDIGNSDKKKQTFTNGQFGFGIYSFMAFYESLKIQSQQSGKVESDYVHILKKEFNRDKVEDMRINCISKPKLSSCGTTIMLEKSIKKLKINLQEIERQIRDHFELILSRKNLTIELRNEKNSQSIICSPYNYEQHEGETYKSSIPSITLKGNKKIVFDNPIDVYLKITKDIDLERPPFFILKGRRIMDISNTESFKSKNKQLLWKHPHITGYVDLKSNLEPVIHRKGFKATKFLDPVNNLLLQLEPHIKELMKSIDKEREDKGYSKVNDELNKAMAKLSKKVNLMFRTRLLKGNEVPAEKGDDMGGPGGGAHVRIGPSKKDPKPVETPGGNNPGSGAGDDDTKSGDGSNGSGFTEPDNPYDDDLDKAKETKKVGFDIKIIGGKVPENTDGVLLKSRYLNGEITVFREHPDFLKRLNRTRQNEKVITDRLIFYLSTQITTHYLDMLYNSKGQQPEYSKKLFIELTDVQLDFEELIIHLEGTNLSDFGT